MLGLRRLIAVAALALVCAGCSGLDGGSPAALPALPSLPAFPTFPQTAQTPPPAEPQPIAAAHAEAAKEPAAPEVNIHAGAAPVKTAVVQSLQGLGYKIAQDNAYWTVLTKLSGSRLTTTRLTVTFGSIGTQTRVIADLRRVAVGSNEIEPAPDHPDRGAIQQRLNQVKAEIESKPAPAAPAIAAAPPSPLASKPVPASAPPAPLAQSAPSSPPPAQPQTTSGTTLAPLPAATSVGTAPPLPASTQPAPATTATAAAPPAPAAEPAAPVQSSKPARNPLSDWLPDIQTPSLFPAPQPAAPPDDRPLRKGQTRVRL